MGNFLYAMSRMLAGTGSRLVFVVILQTEYDLDVDTILRLTK
jgi:hypothetical protein